LSAGVAEAVVGDPIPETEVPNAPGRLGYDIEPLAPLTLLEFAAVAEEDRAWLLVALEVLRSSAKSV